MDCKPLFSSINSLLHSSDYYKEHIKTNFYPVLFIRVEGNFEMISCEDFEMLSCEDFEKMMPWFIVLRFQPMWRLKHCFMCQRTKEEPVEIYLFIYLFYLFFVSVSFHVYIQPGQQV